MLNTKYKKGGYKTINYNGCLYLFILRTGALFQIDDKLNEVLENDDEYFDPSLLNNGDPEMIVEELKKAGMLEFDESFINENSCFDEKTVNNLVLMLSQACNLRCTYCYADGGEYNNRGFMTQEIAQKAIDFIFKTSEKKEISINLFGGEPLLNFEMYKFCVEYSKKKAIETNKKVYFSTTTNGTLLNEEIASFLEQNKFAITLSIDGNESTHDKNRFYANGDGTYNEIVEKVRKYLKIDNITARATLTNFNTNIDEIYDHLYSLGFASIQVTHSINMLDEEGFNYLGLAYKKMITKFKDALADCNYDYCKKMSNVSSILNRFYNGGIKEKFCGAGNNMMAVDIDGSIFACHRLVNNIETKYGTIFDGYNQNLRKHIIEEMVHSINEECNVCWCKSLCGGGCPSENLISNNDIKIPHQNTCKLFRNNAENFLKLYIDMDEEQKEILFEKKNKHNVSAKS